MVVWKSAHAQACGHQRGRKLVGHICHIKRWISGRFHDFWNHILNRSQSRQ